MKGMTVMFLMLCNLKFIWNLFDFDFGFFLTHAEHMNERRFDSGSIIWKIKYPFNKKIIQRKQ